MYTSTPDAVAAEIVYRQDRLAAEFRRSADSRRRRYHRPRRQERDQAC